LKRVISIVIPCYNEEANIDELGRRLGIVMDSLADYRFEVVLVENGSRDNTWAKINEWCEKDARFRSIRLSRNFTASGGMSAGLKYATGDAAIVMCADLQDPPERIPELVSFWAGGYDVAYQVVTERQGISFYYSWLSQVYHWMMNKLTAGNFPKNGTIFRIMDRTVVEAFNSFNETNRYFTGLCNWMGFKSVGVSFPHEVRYAGTTKVRPFYIINLALNGVFAFSYIPLKLMTVTGVLITTVSSIYLVYLVGTILVHGTKAVPGLAAQTSITVFMFGMLFLFIGIIGEYLARIYDEVKRRPVFIVKEKRGFPEVSVRGFYRSGKIILTSSNDHLSQAKEVTVLLDRSPIDKAFDEETVLPTRDC